MTAPHREAKAGEPCPSQTPIVITSLNNPAVRRIRRLRLRKERQRTGLFFVEGSRFVRAALEQGAEIETLVLAPEQWDVWQSFELPADRLRASLPTLHVAPEVL